MSRTLKEITKELYPRCCGESYAPDDEAHEDYRMSISWRMEGAIHFCLLDVVHHAMFKLEDGNLTEEQRKSWALWQELAFVLIDKICKAKFPDSFKEVPLDESSLFEKVEEAKPKRNCDVYAPEVLLKEFLNEMPEEVKNGTTEHERKLVELTAKGVIDALFAPYNPEKESEAAK